VQYRVGLGPNWLVKNVSIIMRSLDIRTYELYNQDTEILCNVPNVIWRPRPDPIKKKITAVMEVIMINLFSK
jgi:hypothetical protein